MPKKIKTLIMGLFLALHTSCGFRLVGYREKIGQDHFGVWRNTLLMERRSARDDFLAAILAAASAAETKNKRNT